jgi:Asp-tRNA(Asn)/Glu-tRNA(Gln) amidotransferase A subunit family amidase
LSLQELGLRDQARAVAAGDVSARELLEAMTARRDAVDGVVNAIVALAPPDARDGSRGARRTGPLAGVPIAIKDSFALPWWAPRDATAVEAPVGRGESAVYRQLRAAGASVCAVANMHQLAIGSTGTLSAYGPCANPWDLERCAGGSSSGSAAAVAASIVAGSIGTDGAGSIRIPASWCGLTGLKPTWGAVPVRGYTGAHSSLGAIGPLARDAGDCRVLAEVLLGRPLPRRSTGGISIGVPDAAYWSCVQPAVQERCRAAVEVLRRAGCTVRPVGFEGAEHSLMAVLLRGGAERAARLDGRWLAAAGPTLDPVIRAIVKGHFADSAPSLVLADRARAQLRRELRRLFAGVDVLAWPTCPAPAPPLADTVLELPAGRVPADIGTVAQTAVANLTGIPALSVPCGLVGGLPVGLMLHASWGSEGLLLDLGETFERETGRAHVGPAPLNPPSA